MHFDADCGGIKSPTPRRRRERSLLDEALTRSESERRAFPGITDDATRESFVDNLVECGRAADSVRSLAVNHTDGACSDPDTDSFDLLCGAVARNGCGDIDNACWLVFLTVAFGESPEHGLPMTNTTYRRVGESGVWDWNSVSSDTRAFRAWFQGNRHRFAELKIGNHRKFESLDDQKGFGKTVDTYVKWVRQEGTHAAWIDAVRRRTDPFDALYSSLEGVHRFGRLARFDLLCRLEALGIVDFTPRRAYMQGATGPLTGARLLYDCPKGTWDGRPLILDGLLIELESYLNVGFDVLKDALCQWQKRPNSVVAGMCGARAAPLSFNSTQSSHRC